MQLKQRLVLYREHIKHKQYQMIEVEEHLRECGKGNFFMFPILQVKQNDTIIRRNLEANLIKKYKPSLNRRK